MHDQLRRLDEDLAAGRLDADTYRRRRDEMLAARLPEPPSTPPPPGGPEGGAASPAAPPSTAPPPAAPPPWGEPGASVVPTPSSDDLDDAELDDAERELELAPDLPFPPPTREAPPARTASTETAAGGPRPPSAPAPTSAPTSAPTPADVTDDVGVRAGADGEAPRERDGRTGAGVAGRNRTAERDPFPPPFRWGDDTPPGSGDPSPDPTQVVAASLARAVEITPERTQVVPNGWGLTPGDDGPGASADPTQVVGRPRVRGLDPRPAAAPGPTRSRPLAPPMAPAPPERTQFVPATALARAGERRTVPARDTTPPWADGRSIPPPDGPRQGREVFTRGTAPSATTVAGTAAVVLVVAVVLVLSFLLN